MTRVLVSFSVEFGGFVPMHIMLRMRSTTYCTYSVNDLKHEYILSMCLARAPVRLRRAAF